MRWNCCCGSYFTVERRQLDIDMRLSDNEICVDTDQFNVFIWCSLLTVDYRMYLLNIGSTCCPNKTHCFAFFQIWKCKYLIHLFKCLTGEKKKLFLSHTFSLSIVRIQYFPENVYASIYVNIYFYFSNWLIYAAIYLTDQCNACICL